MILACVLDQFLIAEQYQGKGLINYTYDNTRDGFGVPTVEKKKFNADSIYKNGSKYYLKNSPNDISIY